MVDADMMFDFLIVAGVIGSLIILTMLVFGKNEADIDD